MIETDGGRQQRLSEGGIVAVGRGNEAEQGQAGAIAKQGMDAVAPPQRPGVMVWGVAQRGIRVAPAPGQDRRAVHHEVSSAEQVQMEHELD